MYSGPAAGPDSVAPRPGIETLHLDVRDPGSVRRCVQEVIERAGAIEVLVNDAGYALIGGVEESSEAEIAAQFDTNFYGVVRLTQAVLPHMRARGNGRILNLSSLAGRVALLIVVSAPGASMVVVDSATKSFSSPEFPFKRDDHALNSRVGGTIRTRRRDGANSYFRSCVA
jgi:NAD(P)-dependent dehydrogenase (short-subunit alcohol dehydrogenase family)